jgi:hypothetical protein
MRVPVSFAGHCTLVAPVLSLDTCPSSRLTRARRTRSVPAAHEDGLVLCEKRKVSDRSFRSGGRRGSAGFDLGRHAPHIGAVGIAEPRPSLQDSRSWSATSSNFTFTGHKEDRLVKEVSEAIAAHLRKNVVVTAGIHWDALTPRELLICAEPRAATGAQDLSWAKHRQPGRRPRFHARGCFATFQAA